MVFCSRSLQAFLFLVIWFQFLSLSFFKSFTTSSVFFPHPLVLNPEGFQSVNFLTSFIFSILLRCPHCFILCGFIYLVISSPFINFYNLLLFLILHPSLDLTDRNIFLNICLSKINKLFISHIGNVQVTTSLIKSRKFSI